MTREILFNIGGVYGDKAAAIDRFCETVDRLAPDLRRRIVIENDERHYNPADVLAISRRTDLPVVFGSLPYSVNSGEGELDGWLRAIFTTWSEADGLPKVHFSSQAADGRIGNHAAEADPLEFKHWVKR